MLERGRHRERERERELIWSDDVRVMMTESIDDDERVPSSHP